MPILIFILLICAKVTQSASTKAYNRCGGPSDAFNFLKSTFSFFFLLIIALPSFTFHVPTALYGLGYGVLLCISMYSGYRALALGPMALTSMLVSFSVVAPLVWGIAVRGETLGILQIIALVLLAIAIITLNLDKILKAREKNGEKDNYLLWLLFVLITFICDGFASVIQKEHQIAFPSMYSREFTLFATLLCAIVFSSVSLFKIKKRSFKEIKGKKFAFLSGLGNSLASFLTVVLAGMENASVLFPAITAGTMALVLVAGIVFFKEKLKLNQLIALILGVTAIILLKL